MLDKQSNVVLVEHNGGKKRHVEIPEGWLKVADFTNAEKDDKFYNLMTRRFQFVEEDDIGVLSQNFSLLIRELHPKKENGNGNAA